MKRKTVFILAVLSSITAVNSFAKKTTERLDTLKTYLLQDVQVLSTRASKTTPVAYTNVQKSDIDKINTGKDIPYLLNFTPSATFTSDAGNGIGYTSIRFRGSAPSSTNITVNGVPQADAESATLFWVNMGDFASNLQSMQIQRGVGTSTNGAGAFGATINMQTENIGIKPYFALDFSGGSYHSHKESVRFSTGLINEHWGVQGRLSNIGSKGYIDRASTKLNSYFLQGGYFSDNTVVKLITFNGTERTYHAWNYSSLKEREQYGRTYNSCGVYTDANGILRYYDGQTDNYHQQNYQLVWDQFLSKLWSMSMTLHYTKGKGYYEEYKENQVWARYLLTDDRSIRGDLVRQKKMDNDFYGTVYSFNYDNKKGLSANIGGSWNEYDGDHFGLVTWVNSTNITSLFVNPNNQYYNNRSKKTDTNIYGKVTWEFTKGLSVFADLQYRYVFYKRNGTTDKWSSNVQNQYNIRDAFNFFNPKFGLNYNINNNHRIYASYAIAHREPNGDDYKNNFNKELKAERLGDLEIGYKYLNKTFSAGANFYYMNYSNQFVLTGSLNEIGEPVSKNVGKSYRMGLELEAAYRPINWFRWDINATISKNEIKDNMIEVGSEIVSLGNTPLTYSPKFIFNNIFNFDYKGFSANIHTQYTSKQYIDIYGFDHYVNEKSDGTTEKINTTIGKIFNMNLSLAYTRNLKHCGIKSATLGVTLYNVFNSLYDTNGALWYASHKKDASGKVIAYNSDDAYEAVFSAAAPFNVMFNLSLTF